jgi:transcription elongation factor Elf1
MCIEIELDKGQAGYKGVSCCEICKHFIEDELDSVRIEVDYHSEWVHLTCFMDLIKPVINKAKQIRKFQFR